MAVEQPAAAIPLAAALAVTGIVLAAGFVAAYLLRRKGSR
jgi:hypothetical protein